MLNAEGTKTLIWPLTEIRFVNEPVDLPSALDGVVFSSANAVRAFSQCSDERGLTAFCVGGRTSELARAAGFTDVRSADGGFDDLVELIRASAPGSVHYLRGENVSGDLAAALETIGIACTSSVVYRAEPTNGPDKDVRGTLLSGSLDVVTIWSRRNADLFCESLQRNPDWQISRSTLVCISETALGELGKMGFQRTIIASRPNATQMISGIRAALR